MPDKTKEVDMKAVEARTKIDDLRAAASAMNRCKVILEEHNNMISAIGYPSQYWSDMNLYRGLMNKYGLL